MWEAKDVALVVSTSAAAIVSVLSLFLPFMREKALKKAEQYRALEAEIYAHITDCVERLERVVMQTMAEQLIKAHLGAGGETLEELKRFIVKHEEVNVQANLCRFKCSLLGVDAGRFAKLCLAHTQKSNPAPDTEEPGRGDAPDGESPRIRARNELLEEAAALATKVREAADKKARISLLPWRW